MGSRIKGGGRAVLSAESQAAIIDLLMGLEAEDGNQGAGDGGDVSAHEQRRRRKRFAKRLVQRHERRRLRERFNALSIGGGAEEESGGRSRNNDVAQTPRLQPSAAAASSSPNVRVELVEAIFKGDGKKKKVKEKERKDKKKSSDRKKKAFDGCDFTIGAKKVVVLPRTTYVKELLKSCKSKLKMKKSPVRAFVKVDGGSSAMFDLDVDLGGVEDGTIVYVSVTPAPAKDIEEEGNASDEEGDAAADEEMEDPLESVKRAYRQQELHRQPKQLKRMDEIVDEKKRAAFEVVRSKLPVAAHKQRILEAIDANPVVVLSGTTGSGKSTQVPQFLLEGRPLDPKRPYIVVTQPRRVAATSLAQRVAEERGCSPPGASGSSVGYMVRSDRRVDLRSCQIIYVTIGILLRMLVGRRDDGASSDAEDDIVPQLSINTISHLIIDETHERDVNTDFSLTLLKGMMASSTTSFMPRLVLMSATASTGLFVSYFSTKGVVPASIEVPGKTFPVDTQWLGNCEKFTGKTLRTHGGGSDRSDIRGGGERSGGDDGVALSPRAAEAIDNEFVRSLVVAIVKQQQSEGNMDDATTSGEYRSTGAVLVFLPGLGEIESLARCLFEKGTILSDRGLCKIYKLHSLVPKSEQRVVFQPALRGTVKIVLATNIAETSVTIPDISHVIDTCRVKESRYNASTRIKELLTVWTSLASMKQRAGRAGRTSNGTCWRLCSEEFAKGLLPHTVPEMARTPLDELILQIGLLYEQRRDEHNCGTAQGGDAKRRRAFAPGFLPIRFLSMTPTPPAERGLAQACKHLLEVEALRVVDYGSSADKQSLLYRLSPLGYHLSRLPMDAKVGKMLIVGCLLGCLDNALTIAAALSCAKSCFMPNRNLDPAKPEARDSLIENGFGGKDWTGGTVKGDLIAVIAVFRAWRAEKKSDRDKFCRRHALNSTSLREMETMQKQFRDLMVDAGLVSRSEGTNDPGGDDSNVARDDALLTSCCIVGGLYPNVCTLIRPTGPKGGGRLLTHDNNASCRPSSNSFQRKRVQNASKSGKDGYAMYFAKHQSIGTATPGQRRPPETFLSEVNFVSTFALLLFGGELELVKNALIVDKWLKFKISSDDDEDKAKQNAVLILSLRELLDNVILEHVVETFAPPEERATMVERHKTILAVIRKVLADEG